MKTATTRDDDGILRGAPAIALEYYGDADRCRTIYTNPDNLPIFRYRRQLCAFKTALAAHREAIRKQKETLRARMEKEAATSARFCRPMSPPKRKSRPPSPREAGSFFWRPPASARFHKCLQNLDRSSMTRKRRTTVA
jgi:hypothetical protein